MWLHRSQISNYYYCSYFSRYCFFSASQDIVIDAYRRELLLDPELGLGNAVHVNAYKFASLVPGSLSLILADFFPGNSYLALQLCL